MNNEWVEMMDEELWVPLSGIQHYVFCDRRAALILLEGQWAHNQATTEGTRLHRKTETGKREWNDGVLIVRNLRVHSRRLGVCGFADVVEFHPTSNEDGVVLPSLKGRWIPFPVEYKRGRLRRELGYMQQLCAQALCLEEMLRAPIPEGAIFFGKTRRRLSVAFDKELREQTHQTIASLHQLMESEKTPVAREQAKCSHCSLYERCSPVGLKSSAAIQRYLDRFIHTVSVSENEA